MNLANKLTITRLILIPIFYIFLTPLPSMVAAKITWLNINHSSSVYFAIFLFILAAITDKLDGYVARKYNQVTTLGKLFDPLADKLMIIAALIALVDMQLISTWFAVIIIGREFMVTLIRIMASGRGVDLSADRFGKLKMVLQVSAIIVVLLHHVLFIQFTTFPLDLIFMIVAVILTLLSGINYVRKNVNVLYV